MPVQSLAALQVSAQSHPQPARPFGGTAIEKSPGSDGASSAPAQKRKLTVRQEVIT
jgi:hypothetical protein